MDCQQHKSNYTEPARNPSAAPDYMSKQNFATSPKPDYGTVNCSDDQLKCPLQDQFQAPGRAQQGIGRRVNLFTLRKSIISFLGSCAWVSRPARTIKLLLWEHEFYGTIVDRQWERSVRLFMRINRACYNSPEEHNSLSHCSACRKTAFTTKAVRIHLHSYVYWTVHHLDSWITTPAKPHRNTNTHRTRTIQPMK